MYGIILALHVICCILLVAIVLLQVGRGRGMLGFLGGGTAETLFGSRTGDVLTKSTTVIAVLFMVTSLSLAYISIHRGASVMKGVSRPTGVMPPGEEAGAPALPEDRFIQKGASFIEKAKQKLIEKIPRLTKGEKPEVGLTPTITTKSKVRYDERGNKIVEELKYDPQGALIGHTRITYDRLGKELERVELPLVEEELEAAGPGLPKE